MPDRFDNLERRCPRLGGPVRFAYCRTAGTDPCYKVFDCWWERFDVTGYFRQHLSRAAFERLAATRPPDKMVGLLDVIRQAQERTQGDG